MSNSVKIQAPASLSNLTCGFDILGMAIDAPFDLMEIRLIDEPVIRIKHADEFGLPEIPEHNVAGVALNALTRAYKKKVGFEVIINKGIRPGSGLGSSAASAAGAVVGANHLLGGVFSREEIVQFAMEGEELASGSKHPDNIVPCIYGGLILTRSMFPLDIIQLPVPPMFVAVVHPQIEIKTSHAREILPKSIALKDAVRNWANVGGLVAGFMKGDYELIGRSMEDNIIEPVRKGLIPGFDLVKSRAKQAGVIGGGISGSGPAIFMFTNEKTIARKVELLMKEIYEEIGLDFKTYVTTINNEGCKVIS
jgi:homoserine kinase